MSKRFSESSRWDDPWYRNLKPKLKNFWDFLCMRPDAAGVWKPDWEDIKFRIGIKIDPITAINSFNEGKLRINILNNGYWQILGWVDFQFGEVLNEKIGQHRASIFLINKYRDFGYLEGKSYPIPSPTHGLFISPVEKELEIETTIQQKQHKFKYLENAEFVACFNDYLDMRKKIRKPATQRAEQLALKSLHENPLDTAIKMLNQSVMNSWQGIFPLRDEKKQVNTPLPSIKHEVFKPKWGIKPDPNQQEEVSRLMKETLKNMAEVK